MTEGLVRGGCYCGRVRFEVELPTKFIAHCHCGNCRRAHGAGAVSWAGFLAGQLRFLEGEDGLVRFTTDTQATRSFCGTCGTTMLFEGPRWEGEVHVAVACLDGPLPALPSAHAYADRAPDWFPITDGLEQFGGEDGATAL